MDKKRVGQIKEQFDLVIHSDENANIEFWYARELMSLLGYERWNNFDKAISRAMDSCESGGIEVSDHFREVAKMVPLGSGSQREIKDYMLTRYACYLIAQNGDPKKEEIAFAQSYFAVQTRKQIIEVLIEYGAKPLISTEELAIIMTYGIGNLFLRDKESRLAGTDRESMKTTALLFGLDLEYVSLTLPRIPYAEEAEKITALAELCSENFADYNAERMARLIKKRMSSGEIFVIAHKNNIAGFIMFSKKNKMIDHIAVSPDYRRIGIASRLMVTAMAQFEVGEELSAVTFRQEHPMSDGVSRMYKKFGFDNEKNIVVRGEPLVRRTAVVPEKATITE